jgi:hypothetical protein
MASDMSTRGGEAWHLQRGVPVAFIVALFVQTITGVWIGAATVTSLRSEQADHLRRIQLLEAADVRLSDESRRVEQVLARLDERLAAQTAILRRLEEAIAPPQRRDGSR